MIVLTEEDALFLGFSQHRVKEKQLLTALNKKLTLYTDTRFAPDDAATNLEHVRRIALHFNIELTGFVRPHHFYCGNGYLPNTASVGSLTYCHSRGFPN